MIPASLATEALTFAWATQVGGSTWEEVILWADRWILKLDAPPEQLLELSLSGQQPHQAWSLLRQLAREGKPDQALSLLVRRLRDGIQVKRVDPLDLSSRLEDISFLGLPEEPDDVRLPPPPPKFYEAAQQLRYLHFFLRDAEGEEVQLYEQNLTEELVTTLERFL